MPDPLFTTVAALTRAVAAAAMADVAVGLDVDARRMAANLDLTRGLVFAEAAQTALAPSIGRERALAGLARALP